MDLYIQYPDLAQLLLADPRKTVKTPRKSPGCNHQHQQKNGQVTRFVFYLTVFVMPCNCAALKLFPLDRARGFGGDVVNYTVYSVNLFDDAAHHGVEKLPRQVDNLCGHCIHTVD